MTLADAHYQNLRRTTVGHASHWWMSAMILTIVFVSFRPFTSSDVNEPGQQSASGDIVNQVGFGLLGIICAYIMAKKVAPETIRALMHPLWILLVPFLALAVWNADVPASAMRAMLFSVIVVLAAATELSYTKSNAEAS